MSEIPDDSSDEEVERALDDVKAAVVKFVRKEIRKGTPIKEAWKRTARELDAELKTKSLGSRGRSNETDGKKD